MDAMADTRAESGHLTVVDAARQGLARARADEDVVCADDGTAGADGTADGGTAREAVSPQAVSAPAAGARAGAAELRHRRVRLTREPAAAALARGEVRAAISDWGVDVDADLAVLLASDLVTNAILRGEGEKITFVVRCTAGRLRVDVYDTWRALPVAVETGASSASGPGLALIAAMASEWGTFRIPSGMAVYFALDCDAGTELPRGADAPCAPGTMRGDDGL